MAVRAKQGGEVAPNGSFYKGGQFINTIAANPKQSAISRPAKASKVQIAPYQWAMVETIEQRMSCVYGKIADACRFTETSFKSGDWKVDRATVNYGYLEYIQMSPERFTELADMFDSGIRFEA
jgi:hypothetical protein